MLVDTILGWSTAIGAALAPVQNLGAGDTLTVRTFSDPDKAWLVNLWNDRQALGAVRLRSPLMNNFDQGIAYDDDVPGGVGGFMVPQYPFLPLGAPTRMYSADQLVLEHSGSIVAGAIESVILMLAYQRLKGGSGTENYIDDKTLYSRYDSLMTVRTTIAAGVTGGYSGATLLNTFTGAGDFKANRDYALVGARIFSTRVADGTIGAVTIRGTDTGQLRYPIPGSPDAHFTSNYCLRMSKVLGMPLIPVINQANAQGTTVEVVNTENAATVTLDLNFVMLT